MVKPLMLLFCIHLCYHILASYCELLMLLHDP
jgi:hypothetical protein